MLWRKHRLQALLSTLGIIAGISGLVLVIALAEGAREEMDNTLTKLGSGTLIVKSTEDGASPLHGARAESLTRLLGSHLHLLAPIKTLTTPVSNDEILIDAVRVTGTTRDYREIFSLQLHQGRFLVDLDLERRQRVCVLGWELGRSLFPRREVLGSELRIGSEWYLVVGWLKPGAVDLTTLKSLGLSHYDQSVYVPVTTLVETSLRVPLSELALRFRDERQLGDALDLVRRTIEHDSAQGVVEYLMPVELLKQRQRVQGIFQYLLLGIAGLMLVVGGIGVMNIMLVNVANRRAEIGLRRAVGATRTDILAQFLTESLVVTLVGGACGVVAGFALILIAQWWSNWPMVFSPRAALIGFSVSLLIGVAFGTYPALQAVKITPVRALN
ncbi:MAG: ABC transporter permease [Porticoccaceae bacterium]